MRNRRLARWRSMTILAALLLAALVFSQAGPPVAEAQSPPDSVGSVSITRADGSLTASWDAPAGATKYHVTYNDGSGWKAPVDDHRNVRTTSITFSVDNSKTVVVGVRRRQRQRMERLGKLRVLRPIHHHRGPGLAARRAEQHHLGAHRRRIPRQGHAHRLLARRLRRDQVPGELHRRQRARLEDPCLRAYIHSITFEIWNGYTYIIAVRAGNANGWSAWTNSPESPPIPNPPPPTLLPGPDWVSVTRGNGTLTATWAPVSGAIKYLIRYSTDGWRNAILLSDSHTPPASP